MRTHLRLTAALFFLAGLLFAAMALLSPFLFAAAANSAIDEGDDGAALASAVLQLTGRALAIGGAVFAVPSAVCGWGLLRRRPWSRWLAILLAAIAVVQFPVGTVIGGYVLWVMLSAQSEPWFEGGVGAGDAGAP
jgi:uncharacterized membrane protein (DUF2068 family)